MGRRTALVLILLSVVGLVLWSWPKRSGDPGRQASSSQSTAASSEARTGNATAAALDRETRRLNALQADLSQLSAENQTAELMTQRQREAADRMQGIKDQINAEVRGTASNDRLEKTYQQNNVRGRNSALIGLEAEIQNMDAQIAALQAQAAPARNVQSSPFAIPAPAPEPLVDPNAPPQPTADQAIAQMQARKAQLQSQINIENLSAQNADIQISQEADFAREQSRLLREDLQRQLNDVQQEEAYWRGQAANTGDSNLRRVRMEYLDAQIAQQRGKVQELQNQSVRR